MKLDMLGIQAFVSVATLGSLVRAAEALSVTSPALTAVGLAAQGLGAAIVPQLSIPPGAYPQLKLIDLVEPVVERSFVLVRRKGSALSPAARALHELILARVRSGVADK
jgi:DNA-binding transcriptional LysR family regulator